MLLRPVSMVRTAAALALVAATATACASDGSTAPGEAVRSTAGASTTTSADAPPVDASTLPPSSNPAGGAVPASLQFTAPGVGGTTIDFAQFAGTPLVLWFWAPG